MTTTKTPGIPALNCPIVGPHPAHEWDGKPHDGRVPKFWCDHDYPVAEHLAGPWFAVLADHAGFVYDSVADARENAEDTDETFEISVRRGTAAVITPAGDRGRLPGSYHCGDLAYELDVYLDVYLDDPSVAAAARLAQAQAMAAGLNTRWRRLSHAPSTAPEATR